MSKAFIILLLSLLSACAVQPESVQDSSAAAHEYRVVLPYDS